MVIKNGSLFLGKSNLKVSEKDVIEAKNKEYIQHRKNEYNKLNQFEMQSDDLLNSTTTWIDAIKAIKLKYPKPEV